MKKKKVVIALGAVLAAILVLALVVLGIFKSYYNKSNYVEDEDIELMDLTGIEEAQEDAVDLSPEEEEALRKVAESSIGEMGEVEGVYSILLVGVDRRDTSWYGNSDTMILITVNSNTETIYMTSFMRDLYADIPQIGVRKLNAAYANGAGPLLVKTIEENYKVSIDNYAAVDFSGMTEIVDIIGGVDIDVSDAEINTANTYIKQLCNLQGLDSSGYLLTSGGNLHLNGIQALAYTRIRYVGNADFERTSRQRTVLNEIIKIFKTYSVSEITSVMDDILPLITHNISQSDTIKLIAQLPTILKYDVEELRIPYDDMYTISNEILIPDMDATITKLRDTIYATQ